VSVAALAFVSIFRAQHICSHTDRQTDRRTDTQTDTHTQAYVGALDQQTSPACSQTCECIFLVSASATARVCVRARVCVCEYCIREQYEGSCKREEDTVLNSMLLMYALYTHAKRKHCP
jgi:hypothetical protein